MALLGLEKSEISLRLIQNGKVYSVVVKDKITITREKNAASKLSCTILRDTITPEVGNALAFTLDRMHNQFYGFIVTTRKSGDWCDIEAYDQLYYMNRNKLRFSYEDATITEVAQWICKDRGYGMLDPPNMDDTEYKIPLRIEENVSDLTIITTGLDLTYEATGKRFYIFDDFGNICIHHEGKLAADCNLFLTRAYMEDYSYDSTLDDCWTAARIEERIVDNGSKSSKEDNKVEIKTTTLRSEEAIERYGFLEAFDELEEGENPNNKAQQILNNSLPPNQSLTLSGVQGDITVRGGTPILVDMFTGERAEFIRGWFSVDSVTHNFEDGIHTMDLTASLLVELNDWGNTDPSYHSYPYGIL